MSSSLITSPGSTVSLINGGSACGVEWQVGSSAASIGSGTTFVGNILSLTSIALDTGANLTGRALCRGGPPAPGGAEGHPYWFLTCMRPRR